MQHDDVPTDLQLRVALDRTRGLDIIERVYTTSGLIVTVITRNWIEAVDRDGNVIRDKHI